MYSSRQTTFIFTVMIISAFTSFLICTDSHTPGKPVYRGGTGPPKNMRLSFRLSSHDLGEQLYWLHPSIHVAGTPSPQKVAIEFYYIGASLKKLG